MGIIAQLVTDQIQQQQSWNLMVREYLMLRQTDMTSNWNIISFSKNSRALQVTVEQSILNCQRIIIPYGVQ